MNEGLKSICTSLLSCYWRMVTRYVIPAVCGACDMLLRERLRMRERERKKRAGCKERKRHSAHTMGCLNVTVALMGISYTHSKKFLYIFFVSFPLKKYVVYEFAITTIIKINILSTISEILVFITVMVFAQSTREEGNPSYFKFSRFGHFTDNER